MAHSIQEYRGKSEVINDLDLIALFILLRDTSPPAGHRALEGWDYSLRHYGPGLIDLALDRLTETDVQEFATFIRGARERLGGFGEHIPQSVLQARNVTPGIVFADYPVRLLVNAAERLENLVSPQRTK